MAPNLEELLVVVGTFLGFPLFLGGVATLLAGSEGAASGPRLSIGRHLIAALAGWSAA